MVFSRKVLNPQPEYPEVSERGPQADKLSSDTSQPEEDSTQNKESLYLDGDEMHTVWKPRSIRRWSTRDIHMRRNMLLNRVWATQQVLKVQREDGPSTPEKRHSTNMERKMWKRAITNVIDDNAKKDKGKRSSKKNLHFHDVVSGYMARVGSDGAVAYSATSQANEEARSAMRQWKSGYIEECKLHGMATVPDPIIEEDTDM